MGAFIAQQPNGFYCRFSTVVDTVTHWNMTQDEYIEMCAEKARQKAKETLANSLHPYEMVKDMFVPTNMTKKEFKNIINEMENPAKELNINL